MPGASTSAKIGTAPGVPLRIPLCQTETRSDHDDGLNSMGFRLSDLIMNRSCRVSFFAFTSSNTAFKRETTSGCALAKSFFWAGSTDRS